MAWCRLDFCCLLSFIRGQLIFRLYFKNQINWLYKRFESKQNKRWNIILNTTTSFIVVVIPFLFFRAHSLPDAWFILKSLFNFGTGALAIGNASTFVYSLIGVVILYIVEIYQEHYSKGEMFPEPKSTGLKYVFTVQ